LKKNYAVAVQWRGFPLHPETPEEGRTLEDLFAGRNIDISRVQERYKTVAAELGLPWGERKMTYNSRLAQELAKWAECQGQGDAFHEAVFRAYFVEGKNIGKIDELVKLAESTALPGKEAGDVLRSRTFRKEVEDDWERAHQLGINAVPTFVLGRQMVVGAQPYETLENLLINGGVKKRA
jgi:predicted DsbA family dithiol-disulfide isomerase